MSSLSNFELFMVAALFAGLVVVLWWGLVKVAGWMLASAGIAPYPVVVERLVMGHVALLVRQNLPLPTGLALAAESERGAARTCLRDISRLMSQGLALSEAAAQARPRASVLTLSLIAAGEKSGQLAGALDQVQEHLGCMDQPSLISWRVVLGYVFLVTVATSLIASLVSVVIFPRFNEIFRDYSASMPALTMSLVTVVDWLASLWLSVLALVAVVLLVRARWRRKPPRRWVRTMDHMRWCMPGLRRAVFSESMATMLATMRLALRSGMDVAAAARLASQVRVNSILCERMKCFADRIENGATASVAAREAGLGEVTSVAMAAGQRSGDMDAALRYAADYHAALVSRLWTTLRNLAGPLSTLVIATVVGWVVLALFLPLIHLIDATIAFGS